MKCKISTRYATLTRCPIFKKHTARPVWGGIFQNRTERHRDVTGSHFLWPGIEMSQAQFLWPAPIHTYHQGRNVVGWQPGQEAFGAPMFEPEVFRKQQYWRMYLWHYWDFSAPPAVIRHSPQWFGVPIVIRRPGNLVPLRRRRYDPVLNAVFLSGMQRDSDCR